jgi:hypothetical protein
MIRLFPRIHRLASVALGTALLHGCATSGVDSPATGGAIDVRPGRAGYVVAAPRGSDVHTASMVAEIARRTGFGLVVAAGGPARALGAGDQVSRPVDRALGQPASARASTEPPGAVAALYERRVLQAAQGPLRFYAEIEDDEHAACAGQLEIATVGVDRELALRLRALAELIRDAYLHSRREIERLAVLVEPVDELTGPASGAGRDGALRLPERGLRIELPRCARRDWREAYTSILADFLSQAVTLPVGR